MWGQKTPLSSDSVVYRPFVTIKVLSDISGLLFGSGLMPDKEDILKVVDLEKKLEEYYVSKGEDSRPATHAAVLFKDLMDELWSDADLEAPEVNAKHKEQIWGMYTLLKNIGDDYAGLSATEIDRHFKASELIGKYLKAYIQGRTLITVEEKEDIGEMMLDNLRRAQYNSDNFKKIKSVLESSPQEQPNIEYLFMLKDMVDRQS